MPDKGRPTTPWKADAIRVDLSLWLLRIAAVVSVPALLMRIVTGVRLGQPDLILYSTVLLLPLVLAAIRPPPHWIRTFLLLAALLLAVTARLFVLNEAPGDWRMFAMLGVIFGVLLLGLPAGIALTALFALLGLLHGLVGAGTVVAWGFPVLQFAMIGMAAVVAIDRAVQQLYRTTARLVRERDEHLGVRRELAELNERLEAEVQARTAELEQGRAEYRDLLESMPAGVMVEDWSALKPGLEALRGRLGGPVVPYLRDHADELRALVESSVPLYSNSQMLMLYAAPDAKALGELFVANAPESHELALIADQLLDGQQRVEFRVDERRCDGRKITVDWIMLVPDEARDDWSRVIGIALDSTRQLAREEMLEQTQRYMTEAVALTDAEGYLVLSNDRLRELLGLPRDRYPDGVWFPTLQQQLAERGVRLPDVAAGGTEVPADTRQLIRLPEGRILECRSRPTPSGGAVTLYADVTQLESARQLLERNLADTGRRLEHLFEVAHWPMIYLDADRRVIMANLAARMLAGVGPGEFGPTQAIGATAEGAGEVAIAQLLDAVYAGGSSPSVELRFTGPVAERQLVIRFEASAQRGPDGQIEGVLLVGHDISAIREAELQALHASKLATIGEMATGMAHEINQPLHIVRMAVGNARRALQQGDAKGIESALGKFERIEAQIDRAGRIVNHLNQFGRMPESEMERIYPAVAIRRALALLADQLRLEQIEQRTELDETAVVEINSDKFEQVLLNLLTNARHAVAGQEEGGRWIEVRCEHVGERVRITVEDSGGGIDASVMAGLFEPFITTKPAGVGTGLGLSISRTIVEDAGGSISAENGPEGARIVLRLPAARPSPAVDRSSPESDGPT